MRLRSKASRSSGEGWKIPNASENRRNQISHQVPQGTKPIGHPRQATQDPQADT